MTRTVGIRFSEPENRSINNALASLDRWLVCGINKARTLAVVKQDAGVRQQRYRRSSFNILPMPDEDRLC